VREALFSILGPGLPRRRVLELYAGSGALGFEALSRGASAVTFVEADDGVRDLLERNAFDLGVGGRCRIVAGEVERVLGGAAVRRGGPFALVLADPPYDAPAGGTLLDELGRPGLLDPDARVVLQRDRRTPPAEPTTGSGGLHRSRTARYGRNCLDFYTFRARRDD
jgi:16S rRNA (guanine966-N2)-methyltransferase